MPHWRNWIAHQTSNLGVVGSSPTVDFLLTIAQLVERQTVVVCNSMELFCRNLLVTGSIPVGENNMKKNYIIIFVFNNIN